MTKKTNEAAKETHPEIPPNFPFKKFERAGHFDFEVTLGCNTVWPDSESPHGRIIIACVAAEYLRIEENRLSRLQKTTADEWLKWGGLIK